MEERLLVKRAKRGDVDAFAELYGKIYKKLYQFALYTLKNPQDAEDVVSEAVTDAFENIGQLKKDEAFSGWMYRIVANKCNRKMREYYNRQEELDEEYVDEDCGAAADRREEYIEVRRVFFELSQMDRMIVGMHIFLGYKTREIAGMLSMNENTVRSRESRAIQRMGEQLKGLR
jgi:RNA polymerase sigma-70 factor (ECF subfamily)